MGRPVTTSLQVPVPVGPSAPCLVQACAAPVGPLIVIEEGPRAAVAGSVAVEGPARLETSPSRHVVAEAAGAPSAAIAPVVLRAARYRVAAAGPPATASEAAVEAAPSRVGPPRRLLGPIRASSRPD